MRRAFALVGFLVVAVMLVRTVVRRHIDDGDGAARLVNRVWLDRLPARDTEFAEVFVAVHRQDGGNRGGFARGSKWKLASELFLFRSVGPGALQIRYPQSGESERVRFRVTPCREDGFTVCLTLDGNSRGIRRYRSNDDLVIRAGEGVDDLQRVLQRARPPGGGN